MKPIARSYQTEEDFWHMREFLRKVFILNNQFQRSWHVARLDYARWHVCLNCAKVRLEDVVHLWESDGQLVAFLMPDGGPGEAHLCVHPGLRTLELEEEMLIIAEEFLTNAMLDGSHSLRVWSPEQDKLMWKLLADEVTQGKTGTNISGDAGLTYPSLKYRLLRDIPSAL